MSEIQDMTMIERIGVFIGFSIICAFFTFLYVRSSISGRGLTASILLVIFIGLLNDSLGLWSVVRGIWIDYNKNPENINTNNDEVFLNLGNTKDVTMIKEFCEKMALENCDECTFNASRFGEYINECFAKKQNEVIR
jgi:hypothetical protein